jgi:PHD/YefM family antitoxin component YafN of YafNO toxin-antitoxin module
MTSEDVARDWRKVAAQAEREPVKVVGEGESSLVVLSEAQYARLKGAARERLKASLRRLHDEAAASGLSASAIEALIADED